MLRRLLDELRIRAAVHDHNTQHRNRVLDVMPTRAELDTIEAFRKLGAQTRFPTRLGQAAQLEAHDVDDELFTVLLRIAGQHAITSDELNQLGQHGIALNIKPHYPTQANKIRRLQHAITTLAPLAGPGFTTQHLIDDGLLEEGDI